MKKRIDKQPQVAPSLLTLRAKLLRIKPINFRLKPLRPLRPLRALKNKRALAIKTLKMKRAK
jgi:hypothetical protein